MAPIHDTDVAEKRWSDEEWRQFELWEKIEIRLRQRRRIWVGLACLLFLILAAVPTVMERWPKWLGRRLSRQLAQELNQLRSQAILEGRAFRIQFLNDNGLAVRVERGERCGDESSSWSLVKELTIRSPEAGTLVQRFRFISASEGAALGIPQIHSEVCVDGVDRVPHGIDSMGGTLPSSQQMTGPSLLAIATSDDISQSREDRISVVVLTGSSLAVEFE
jgi:hypothetical protein